ncbi:hypothetical protein M8J77_012634 [Diaphorina citri]|nr:hypothetical protein M8J77_012634 [Diaphorina citri]
MLTEPILSHESEYPFPVVPTVLKLAGQGRQGTSDSADSRARLVLYEPAHSGSITHLVDTIDRHHIGTESCPEISIGSASVITSADAPALAGAVLATPEVDTFVRAWFVACHGNSLM